jgi:elongation factor Ts
MAYIHPYRFLFSYVHNGRIGVLVEMGCETDYLTHTQEFRGLIKDVALQIAATAPSDVEELLQMPFVKDTSRLVEDVLRVASTQFRERIAVTRFIRWSTEFEMPQDDPPPPRAPAVIMSFRRPA